MPAAPHSRHSRRLYRHPQSHAHCDSSRRDDERAGELRRDHPRVRHRPRKPRSAAGPAARYPLAQVARAGPAGVTASTHPQNAIRGHAAGSVGESYGIGSVSVLMRAVATIEYANV